MSNYSETKQELRNYIKAGTPLIIIQSGERERVERMLCAVSSELLTQMYYYTDTRQVTVLGSGGAPMDAHGDPLAFMTDFFKRKRKTVFVFGDVKKISEDSFYTREIVNILYLAKEAQSTVILITNDKVIQSIAAFGMIARLDLPDDEERLEQIRVFAKSYEARFPIDWDDSDFYRAAALLRGFTEIQIENILSNEIVSWGGLYKSNIHKLTSQKQKLYSPSGAVQSIRTTQNISAHGLENLKQWLDEKRKVFFSSDEQLQKFGIESPKGILLTGIPGCGKSFSAKMVASQWELPLLRFDIGSVYDKWMGESERKMREALEYIDNVSPCVLWVDEIEKLLASSDGSNDTSKRILGQFLFWLQESKSRVFLVATANDVTNLPSELFRKGRFSEVFFVDLPDEQDRKTAIDAFCRRCLHVNLNEEQLQGLADISKGYSYSEIEYAVKEAAEQLMLYGAEKFSLEVIRQKFLTVVPIEKRNMETVTYLRKWGSERAVPAHKIGG